MKLKESEKVFRKELRRRFEILKVKFPNQVKYGTWNGILETIEREKV